PDPTVGDGSFSNNAWLQELPKPPNKMTWDNAVWISPRTAQRLDVETGDVVEVTINGRKTRGACWVQPGQADDSLTMHFGYGRTAAGRVGNGVGFDVYRLRSSGALDQSAGAELRRISRGYEFSTTQITQTMEDRDPFRVGTIEEYRKNPAF